MDPVGINLYDAFATGCRDAFIEYAEKVRSGKRFEDAWREFEESVMALKIYAKTVSFERREKEAKKDAST